MPPSPPVPAADGGLSGSVAGWRFFSEVVAIFATARVGTTLSSNEAIDQLANTLNLPSQWIREISRGEIRPGLPQEIVWRLIRLHPPPPAKRRWYASTKIPRVRRTAFTDMGWVLAGELVWLMLRHAKGLVLAWAKISYDDLVLIQEGQQPSDSMSRDRLLTAGRRWAAGRPLLPASVLEPSADYLIALGDFLAEKQQLHPSGWQGSGWGLFGFSVTNVINRVGQQVAIADLRSSDEELIRVANGFGYESYDTYGCAARVWRWCRAQVADHERTAIDELIARERERLAQAFLTEVSNLTSHLQVFPSWQKRKWPQLGLALFQARHDTDPYISLEAAAAYLGRPPDHVRLLERGGGYGSYDDIAGILALADLYGMTEEDRVLVNQAVQPRLVELNKERISLLQHQYTRHFKGWSSDWPVLGTMLCRHRSLLRLSLDQVASMVVNCSVSDLERIEGGGGYTTEDRERTRTIFSVYGLTAATKARLEAVLAQPLPDQEISAPVPPSSGEDRWNLQPMISDTPFERYLLSRLGNPGRWLAKDGWVQLVKEIRHACLAKADELEEILAERNIPPTVVNALFTGHGYEQYLALVHVRDFAYLILPSARHGFIDAVIKQCEHQLEKVHFEKLMAAHNRHSPGWEASSLPLLGVLVNKNREQREWSISQLAETAQCDIDDARAIEAGYAYGSPALVHIAGRILDKMQTTGIVSGVGQIGGGEFFLDDAQALLREEADNPYCIYRNYLNTHLPRSHRAEWAEAIVTLYDTRRKLGWSRQDAEDNGAPTVSIIRSLEHGTLTIDRSEDGLISSAVNNLGAVLALIDCYRRELAGRRDPLLAGQNPKLDSAMESISAYGDQLLARYGGGSAGESIRAGPNWLCSQLRLRRQELGWSLAIASQRSNVPDKFIKQMEQGRITFDNFRQTQWVYQIIEAYELSTDVAESARNWVNQRWNELANSHRRQLDDVGGRATSPLYDESWLELAVAARALRETRKLTTQELADQVTAHALQETAKWNNWPDTVRCRESIIDDIEQGRNLDFRESLRVLRYLTEGITGPVSGYVREFEQRMSQALDSEFLAQFPDDIRNSEATQFLLMLQRRISDYPYHAKAILESSDLNIVPDQELRKMRFGNIIRTKNKRVDLLAQGFGLWPISEEARQALTRARSAARGQGARSLEASNSGDEPDPPTPHAVLDYWPGTAVGLRRGIPASPYVRQCRGLPSQM